MHRAFNEVRAKATEELMAIPGVVAVGVGLKQVKGEMQRELCFKVTVEKKLPKSKLKAKERIPEEIYGFKTDVNEMVVVQPGSPDSSKYRPLIGGCQIEGSSGLGKGSLGCFARRDIDSKIVLITNWHVVLGNPDNINGDRTGQPSHNGCCSCCATGEIGEVVDGRFRTNEMDAAIVLLHGQEGDTTPDERFLNEILDIGIIAGSAVPLAGETVWKRGRTTGLTKGQISNDNIPTSTPYSFYNNTTVVRTGQFEITPVDSTDFFIKGDSGSVSVNEHNEVVLLNYAFDGNTHLSYSSKITDVESVLNVSVINSAFHTATAGKEGVPLGAMAGGLMATNLANALGELEQELRDYPEGRRLFELFKLHRPELLDLVRHRREVMAAWHRYQGPAFLSHIARSVRRQGKPIPEQIKGISLQNLLLKMTAVLQRNGSPALQQAVSDNYLQVMHVLASGRSPAEWKAYLATFNNQTLA